MKLFILLQLFSFAIFSQYSSFDVVPSTAEKAGIAGEGIGLSDRSFSLYSNTALLAGQESTVSGGIILATKEKSISPLLPSHFGFYKKLQINSGWGIKSNTKYASLFSGNTKLFTYQFHLFYSYKWENLFFSFGIGPSLGYRGNEYSPLGVTGIFTFGYKLENFTIGFGLLSPGKFSYKAYRGSDPLEERLPETIELGVSYKWESILWYLEGIRILYERSRFYLSDLDEKAKFDRGLGADTKISSGLEIKFSELSNWKFRLGVNTGGKYDAEGRNKRSMGLGLGMTYFVDAEAKGTYLSLGILNYSIFSQKGGRDPETYLLLSGGYLW